MRKGLLVLGAVIATGLLAGPAALQESGATGPSPYQAVEGWLTPFADAGFAFGGNSGVFPESPDRIFVLQRGETRLPDPVPPGFAGFVGSIGINALRAADRRTWQHCIFVVDGERRRDRGLGPVGPSVRGVGRSRAASDTHQSRTIRNAGCGWFTNRGIRYSCSRTTAANC